MPRVIAHYQERAREFSIGDKVFPFAQLSAGTNPTSVSGRVVAVWPAIGMVDVEFPSGQNRRFPVEDLQKTESPDADPPSPEAETVPGGAGSQPVSAGPTGKTARRVARAWVKKALYWGSRDRHYRATRAELDSGHFQCPNCKEGEHFLQNAVYKRENGQSVRLLACKECLFLIKRDQILNHLDPEID